MKTNRAKALFISRAAVIAALYVVLTIVFAPFSFGVVQLRISEALTILPFFTATAVPGLFVGCIIGNILGGAVLPDIIFGSLATLLGAIFTHILRKSSPFLAPIPPIVFNTLIIPFVLKFAYMDEMSLPLIAVFICAGELLSCGVLGLMLLFALKPHRQFIFGDDSNPFPSTRKFFDAVNWKRSR